MSFIKQYSFIIIIITIVFSLQSYLCQQQYRNISSDDNRNKNSSVNETFTTGKLLNSAYYDENAFLSSHILNYMSST